MTDLLALKKIKQSLINQINSDKKHHVNENSPKYYDMTKYISLIKMHPAIESRIDKYFDGIASIGINDPKDDYLISHRTFVLRQSHVITIHQVDHNGIHQFIVLNHKNLLEAINKFLNTIN